MKSIINPVIFFCLMSITSIAQDSFDKAKLDKYFEQLEKHDKVMCSVAVLQDGKVVFSKAIGYASVENKIESSGKTKYRIGSVTKMFTSSMIFQLIEEDKLSLETKLSEYFPKVPNSEKITISDLLYHRSGIFNITNDEKYLNYHTSSKTKKEMLEIISYYESAFEPDSKTEYSNSNYVLLAYIIEKITGLSYAENLKQRITDKLNLTSTYYGGKIGESGNEAFSYSYANGWKKSFETDLSIPHGAGAIVSNPAELVTFIYSLFSGKVISENSLAQMTEIKDGLGRGIFSFPFYDKQAFGHNGAIDHFVSTLGYLKNDNTAFVILANGSNYTLNDVVIGLLSIYFNMEYEIPDFSKKAIDISEEVLKNFVGYYKSDALPLDIEIKIQEGKLFGQATGQSAFPLTPFDDNEFRFDQAGIVIEFSKSGDKINYKSFTLKQGGGNFPFERE